MEYKKYFFSYRGMNAESPNNDTEQYKNVQEVERNDVDPVNEVGEHIQKLMNPIEKALSGSTPEDIAKTKNTVAQRVEGRVGGDPTNLRFYREKIQKDPGIQHLLAHMPNFTA